MSCLPLSALVGNSFGWTKNKIGDSLEKCFFAVQQHVILTSCPLLSVIKKDVLPAFLLSNTVYNFSDRSLFNFLILLTTSLRKQFRVN